MGIQAIIMAGGEGTRLRPLTCDFPKPLVPVLDKPVMAYALDLLHRHHIEQAGATLFYLPERIEQQFGDGAAHGVGMRYWRETRPVGTAGSVRLAKADMDDTFLVLSGDGLTDCDLTAALAAHKKSGALATLVMKKVPVPLEYGVVICEEAGRVRRFVEKPGWGEVFSDTVNTGIYILQKEVLDWVPDGQSYDFGRDLFPRLVQEKQPVFGWVMDGYWCDIGSQEAYVQAQIDMLEGRVGLELSVQPDEERRYIHPEARVSPEARLEGPCWIGAGAQVKAGAHIGHHTVVGAASAVAEGASIKQGVLWRGAAVGRRAQVRGAVVCAGAHVGEEARLFEGSALGDGSTLGDGAQLSPGVKVWPGKQVEGGLRLAANLVWGDCTRFVVDGRGVLTQTPEQAVTLGAAWARVLGVNEMGLMTAPGVQAQAQYAAVSAGLIAQGVRVTLLGEGTLPMLRSMQRQLALPAGIFVHGTRLEVTGQWGVAPSREKQRALETLSVRQDFPGAYAGELAAPRLVRDAHIFYVGALAAHAEAKAIHACPPHAVFFVNEARQQALARALLAALGLAEARVVCGETPQLASWEVGFLLSEDGESLTVLDAQGTPDEGEQALLRYQALLAGGAQDLLAPVQAPRPLEQLAQAAGATVQWVKSAREAMMQALLEVPDATRAARLWQLDVQFDGLAAAVAIISLLAQRRTTLRGLLLELPPVRRVQREVACALADNGRILRLLAEEAEGADLTDGLRVEHEGGWAWLGAVPERGVLRILGEARDAEFAEELCQRYAARVAELQQDFPGENP